MLFKLRSALCFILVLFASNTYAVELDVVSVRTTISKPSTSHVLLHNSNRGEPDNVKTSFGIRPLNNERVGVFVDINGIEIGYASDVFADDIETKTQNFLFSYRKWKHSRITLNFQTLENLNTRARNLTNSAIPTESVFKNTKSTKIELFGLHNLYTFNNKDSSFEHFFLNRPLLSNRFDWSVGIVAGWSVKRLNLENNDSIVFTPAFSGVEIESTEKLSSTSVTADIGPFLSINLPNNVNLFAEYKVGHGYISNRQVSDQLKQSGDEKARAFGAGISWTSSDQKWVVLLRGWRQSGRHISTSFGDLSVIKYF